jgi:hypothetical protein
METKLQIAGITPLLQQALLTALPRAAQAFHTDDVLRDPVAPMTTPAAQNPPTTSVQMLIALAEPALERRRKLAVETDRGVNMLERLHSELVQGVVPPERLQQLADWSAAFEAPEDPQLAALARDVELRVRVELAKHELRV